MTNNQLTEEELQTLIIELQQTAYRLNGTNSAYLMSDAIKPLRELQERRKAAMDSEPVAYIFKHPAGRLFWSLTDKSNKGHDDVMPVYASPQPAPIVEREPIAWLNDAYLARGVVDGEAGSEDAGPGYIPVYRQAHPAPVVMDDRKLRSLFDSWFASDCSFDLSPEASEADNIAWRESYWYVWQRCRAAMLQAGNSPVIPDGYVMVPKEMTDEIGEAIAMQANCCGGIALDIYDAMLAAAPHDTTALNSVQSVDSVAGKWIPVSERMPDVGVKVLCFPVKDEPIHATFNGQLWLQDVSWSGSDDPIDNVIPVSVTHWMPLPAAPQEQKP